MSSLMSMEEVKSLTVPKLKAELTRLNQPLGGLKRKAQLVEALTVSATDEFSRLIYVGSGGGVSFAGKCSLDRGKRGGTLDAEQIYFSGRYVDQTQDTAVLAFVTSTLSVVW